MLNVFISGLTPNSGKTVVAAGLAATMQSLSYSTSVYKPIQLSSQTEFGTRTSKDLAIVKSFDSNVTTLSTYFLSGSSSPFVGAYEDGVKIDLNVIRNEYQTALEHTECNIVEGGNSISSPIIEYVTEIDIVKTLRAPLVLVVNPFKSSIDSVITGLEYIKFHRVNFAGIIITQFDENSEDLEKKYFPQIVQQYSDAKILGVLPDYCKADVCQAEVISDVLTKIDIEQLFGVKIAKLNV